MKLKVLHVDDDEDLLYSASIFMQNIDSDLKIETALSAADALKLLEDNGYDVIISDYQMSEMNGLEFLENLKTSGDSTPFIIFTGQWLFIKN